MNSAYSIEQDDSKMALGGPAVILQMNRYSDTSVEDSPRPSRTSSMESDALSAATSLSSHAHSFTTYNAADIRVQPPIISRLKRSINASSRSKLVEKAPLVELSDFRLLPEIPERRFVDSIGVVCPGVCDRIQCSHPVAHFVSKFRLSEPIEYTTALADHGLTYSDYCRLLAALKRFLEDNQSTGGKTNSRATSPISSLKKQNSFGLHRHKNAESHHGSKDFCGVLDEAKRHAQALNQLLDEISDNLQARGTPVKVSVASFSLFTPHLVSEAHIQILHTPLEVQDKTGGPIPEARFGECLSLTEPHPCLWEERAKVSKSRRACGETNSAKQLATSKEYLQLPHISHNRNRSRPWPLWPNAIPSRNRQFMSDNADRYGLDPYFRAWMRANINSRTRSNTYTKYMIEQEDDPFVNRRLQYLDTVPRGITLLGMMTEGFHRLNHQQFCDINRANYEHNRRLECRKAVENGSRLRILRFGFRNAIYPPHNPEMEELGLTRDAYEAITAKIDDIDSGVAGTKNSMPYLLSSWNRILRRGSEDALLKLNNYIRELNASQRHIVWTIEKLPGVYDRAFAKDQMEWEISAWNGEDPLELLIELERWGIIERRLSLDDDEE